MKQFNSFAPGVLLVITLIAQAGCTSSLSGPSSSSDGNSIEPSLTRGVVSTDNGVSVNGESISLQSATVNIDDEPASVSSLQEGMWVTIGSRGYYRPLLAYRQPGHQAGTGEKRLDAAA